MVSRPSLINVASLSMPINTIESILPDSTTHAPLGSHNHQDRRPLVRRTAFTHLMIAERIRARPHLMPAPRKPVTSPFTHAAPPSPPERLESARAGAARRRDEAAARRAGVVRVDGAHEVELVLPAGERLGAAAAAEVSDGIGAEVPVDDDVRRAGAGGNMVVVQVAVRAHCYGGR
ncbi:hypothetical protein VUR80DRAFT_4633 [Thermomyces stellatus]